MLPIQRVDVAYTLVLDRLGLRLLMVENETVWSLPGGAREAGETLTEAAVREFKEETGLDIVVDDVIHVREKLTDDTHTLFVTFGGRIVGGEIGTVDEEIRQVAWKTFEEAEELIPYLKNIRSLLTNSARYIVE